MVTLNEHDPEFCITNNPLYQGIYFITDFITDFCYIKVSYNVDNKISYESQFPKHDSSTSLQNICLYHPINLDMHSLRHTYLLKFIANKNSFSEKYFGQGRVFYFVQNKVRRDYFLTFKKLPWEANVQRVLFHFLYIWPWHNFDSVAGYDFWIISNALS